MMPTMLAVLADLELAGAPIMVTKRYHVTLGFGTGYVTDMWLV